MFSSNLSYSFQSSRPRHYLKKYKMKSALCLLSVAVFCLVTFALCTASPIEFASAKETITTEDLTTVVDSTSPVSAEPLPAVGYLNNGSRLVITDVVKTVEFVVGIVNDDDNSTETDDSDTATTASPLLETKIEVLNPSLLKEIVREEASSQKPIAIDGAQLDAIKDDDDDDED